MARLRTLAVERDVVDREFGALCAPMDESLVTEVAVDESGEASAAFVGVAGPFTSWSRRVLDLGPVGDPTQGIRRSREEISYSLGLGPWSPGFARLIGRRLKRRALHTSTPVPWWSPPARLDAVPATVIAAAAVLAVLGGFLSALLPITLTFVSGDLGGRVSDQSVVLAVVRVGAVLTLGFMVLADRWGRRQVIRLALVASAMAACLGGLSTSLVQVTISQTIVRAGAAAGVLLLPVLAAEWVPPRARAWCVGVITMAGALGAGMVVWLVPLADVSDSAWRWIWFGAALTIPATLATVARLPESERFVSAEAHRDQLAHPPDPGPRAGSPAQEAEPEAGGHIRARRLALVGAIAFSLNAFVAPVSQLQNAYIRTERGFSATLLTIFIIGTNTWGGIGVVVGGRLADRIGRKRVAVVGLLGIASGNAVMYSVSGWPMWVASVVGSVLGALTIPALGVLGPELFPTGRRGTANGWLNGAGVIGGAAGLLVIGQLIGRWGYGWSFTALTVGPLVVIGLLRWIPETAGLELEEINDADFDDEAHA